MNRFGLIILLHASVMLALASCSNSMDANRYRSDAAVGKVQRGYILAVEEVVIEDASDPSDNQFGALGGGAIGGVAGSSAGKGTGKTLATIGGAIAGAVAGALVEDELSKQNGYQYVVRLVGERGNNPASDINHTRRASESVEDDVKESIRLANTESDVISVIQTDDEALEVGTPVLLIYHEDRPRLIRDSQ